MSHKVVQKGSGALTESGKAVSTFKFNSSMAGATDVKGPGSYELKVSYSIKSTTEHMIGSSSNEESLDITWNLDVNGDGKITVHPNPTIRNRKGDVTDDFVVKIATGQFKGSVKGSVSLSYQATRKKQESKYDIRMEREDFAGSFKVVLNGIKKTVKEKVETVKWVSVPVPIAVGSFAYGDATIKKMSKFSGMVNYAALKTFIKSMPAFTLEMLANDMPPAGKKIQITGYADSSGPEYENDGLSLRRAQAVAKEICGLTGCTNKVLSIKKGGQVKSKKKPPKGDKGFPDCRFASVMFYFVNEV